MSKTAKTGAVPSPVTGRGLHLIVLSGPSGVGKTTVSRAVARRLGLLESISATTRTIRPGETDGADYYFLSREAFERRIADGRFVEWAEVFGRLYGTPVEEIERARAAGRAILLEIDVQGGIQIKRKFPEALAILLLAPDPQALRSRLSRRSTEVPEEAERRFAKAAEEVATARAAGCYDAEAVNDDLATAVNQVASIIETWRKQND